jgi:hypothetical protein
MIVMVMTAMMVMPVMGLQSLMLPSKPQNEFDHTTVAAESHIVPGLFFAPALSQY